MVRPQDNARQSALTLASPGSHIMLHDVVSASFKGGYRIELTFDNSERGEVDFSPYLQRGGVFEEPRFLIVI